ncbi:MAG: PadR family transcriptional regulator [Clostridiales bacterium]|nr:MAG: PadR family transcriptional regulator [Clostridiales bacterium]
MSVTADLIRGHTDAIILAHLIQRDSYGYEINRAISATTGGRFELKEATLYTAFKRLEDAGWIVSYWGNEPSSARRKYYRITAAGRAAYHRQLADWKNAREIIDQLLITEEPVYERETD